MRRVAGFTLTTLALFGFLAGAAQASSVTGVTVTNAPTPGGTTATGAPTVYKTTFTVTTGLSGSQSSTITIAFPTLTGLTNLTNSGIVTDNTTSGHAQVGGSCSASGTTETCRIFGGSTVNAGDSITVELDGVVNPSRASTGYLVSVSTSADTTAAQSNNYTVATAQSVSSVTVTDAPVPGGSTATNAPTVYKTTFTTSSTGGMSGAAGSTITITFPSGTGLTNLTNSGIVTDNTTSGHPQVGGSCSASGTTETCRIFGGSTVNAGDSITVELDGVANPATPSSPTNVYSVSVSTTSDNSAPVTSNSYTVATAQSVNGVTVTNAPVPGGSTATNAPTVYKTTFTTSSTGGMSGAAGSTITITFPSGTGLTNLTNSGIVTDNTTSGHPQVGGSCSASGTTETCRIFGGSTVNAGDSITVELDGVINPNNPSSANNPYFVTASTTSDRAGAVTSNNYTVTTVQSVIGVSVTNSPPTTATGAPTVYKTTFTTSSTGGMSGAAGSTITITFPSGTGLTNLTNSGIVTDNTTSGHPQVGGSCSASGTTETCRIFGGSTVNAGDSITVELDGAVNPGATTGATASVSTTSDNAGPTASGNYTVQSQQQITGVAETLSNTAAGATGITYKTSFKASSTGGMSGAAGSTITMTFPAGTGLTNLTNSGIVTDNTATGRPQVGGSCSASGTTETCRIFGGSSVNGGDSITVELDGVSNPSTQSMTDTVAVSTSSDRNPVNSSPYTIGNGPPPPTVTGISPASGPTAGGTSVTITGTDLTGATAVNFGASGATNVAVLNSTKITATSPPGSGTVDVTVTTSGGTSATSSADRFSYNAPPPPPPPPPASSPPAVSGGAPATATGSGATASGAVNPENLVTTAFFEYGLDPAFRGPGASTTLYDQSTAPQQVGSDAASHTITASLSGLVPGALYHIRLVATNSAGTTFGQDQTFTTAKAAAPAPPVLGQSEDAQPVSGTVFIRLASGQFVKLTGAQQIPSGAVIDALHGTLKITTALPGGQGGAHDAAAKGKGPKPKSRTQSGNFGGAVFKLTQAHNGLTTLSLVEGAFKGAPSYGVCKAHATADPTATAARSRTLQLLKASARGKFRTRGRYSAATIRGTAWTVADRCDGTLTHDITHSVAVTDFVRHKTIILHAGQSYLAKAHK